MGLLGVLVVVGAGCARPGQVSEQAAASPIPQVSAEASVRDPAGTPSPSVTTTPILAARVNGQPIPLSEYTLRLDALRLELALREASVAPQDSDSAAYGEAEHQVLQELVDWTLVQQAATEMGVLPSEQEVDAQVRADMLAGGGDAAFAAWLQATSQTGEGYRAQVRAALVYQRVALAVTGGALPGLSGDQEDARIDLFREWLNERRAGAAIEQWVGK